MERENAAIHPHADWWLARPALSAVTLFAIGIALHRHLWHEPLFFLLLTIGFALAAGTYAGRPRIATSCLAMGIAAAGIARAQIVHYQFDPRDVAFFAIDEPRLAELELRLNEQPHVVVDAGRGHVPPRQTGRATVVAIRTDRGWEPGRGEIVFSVNGVSPALAAGETARFVGMLQRVAPAMNPAEFDWKDYYRRQSILTSIRVSHGCDVNVLSTSAAPLLADARLGIREWIGLGFSPRQQVQRALLAALMLGDRGPELRETERDFQKTGASHLLASTGVRMAMLAGIFYFLARLTRLKPQTAVALATLGVVAWGSVTVASPQALRPVIVAAAIALGVGLRRTIDSIQILAGSAAVILILQPLELFSPGFQFSFAIVLGMLLLTRRFADFLGHFFVNPDEEVLAKFGKLSTAQRIRRWTIRRATQCFAATAIAWIIAIPLVAFHFEQFTPWTMPISLLLSPIVLAALGLGFLKLALTMTLPSAAGAWAGMASPPLTLLHWSIHVLAKLPGADVPVAAPPPWLIIFYYATLCLPLLPARGTRMRWGVRCAPASGLAILLFLPGVLGFARQAAARNVLRITLLSIGAGQCCVVEPPGGAPIMVDAGSSTVSDPLHLCVEPFLHHERQSSIDSIYLSHGDYDHISATAGAWGECGVAQVITTPYFREHANESGPCRHLLEMLDRGGHSPREVCAGQKFSWSNGVDAEVLWPPPGGNYNSNNAGMVLRITFSGKSILFPADIQDPAMRELLKTPARLKSDILVAAHHGSSEPLTAEFVRAVDPRVIVSSDATRLTKKQRDFETLIEHRPLYRTGRCGAIEIDLESDGRAEVKPFLERKQKGTVIDANGMTHGN